MYVGVWVTSKKGSDIQQMSQMRMKKLLERVLKECMETLNIKMTTQQSIELGLVQIIDVHVNV